MNNLSEARKALKTGGFTYSTELGDLTGQPFYAIAISKDYERTFDKLPTDNQIREYLFSTEVKTLLAEGRFAFGGWKNNRGQYVLDVVELVPINEHGAYPALLQLLDERNEEAAFNLATGTEVFRPTTGQIPQSVGIQIPHR